METHREILPGDVVLRDVAEADLLTFFKQQLEPEATRMAAFPARDRDAFMAHWRKILSDPSLGRKTILWGGKVAGNVVSWEQKGQRLVGYWLGKEYWGKGIATQSLAAFLELEKTRPLYAHVAKHNVGSIRVLEKCGFLVMGTNIVPADEAGEETEELIMELK